MIKVIFKIALLVIIALLANSTIANDKTESGFKQLKLLLGDWRGKLPNGNFIDVSYQEINGGAIVERYHSKDPMWWNMSSVYHKDVDKIIMSHYCSWGNHPRMTAKMPEGPVRKLEFSFADIAMTEPDNGYMRDLTFNFQDKDHFTHRWVWHEDGEDTVLHLTMERKSDRLQ